MPHLHPHESPGQALARLAAQARAEGVRIYRDSRDGRHYATSAGHPGVLHYVTGFSCDCLGFILHQQCTHHAALLAALRWIPVPPTPAPPLQLSIHHAAGHFGAQGWLVGTGGTRWYDSVTTIAVDGIAKVRIKGEKHDLRVTWLQDDAPVDDLTANTPPGLTHDEAVHAWVQSLGPGPAIASAPPPTIVSPLADREAA
jgi:hypothetical protein